jgi:hypothetical protein
MVRVFVVGGVSSEREQSDAIEQLVKFNQHVAQRLTLVFAGRCTGMGDLADPTVHGADDAGTLVISELAVVASFGDVNYVDSLSFAVP